MLSEKRSLGNVLAIPAVHTLLTKYKNISDVLTKGLQGMKERAQCMSIYLGRRVSEIHSTISLVKFLT